MSERFYAPDLDAGSTSVVLEGPEHHHLAHVCRKSGGEYVELFNGRGLVARGSIESIGKKHTVLTVDQVHATSDRSVPLTLATALPKGDRTQFLIEKCTELGVAALAPLLCERSVVEPGANKLERLRRYVIEAAKQSGRNWLMEIAPGARWSDFAITEATPKWMLDPRGDEEALSEATLPRVAAIGPEGGWTDAELALGRRHGWRVVRIPGYSLRLETAAIWVACFVRSRAAPG